MERSIQFRSELRSSGERVAFGGRGGRRGCLLVREAARVFAVAPAGPLPVHEALLAAQEAAVLEHVARLGVQRPVAALPGLLGAARHLQEAVVERQRVSAAGRESALKVIS